MLLLNPLSFCLITCKIRLAMPFPGASWHQIRKQQETAAVSLHAQGLSMLPVGSWDFYSDTLGFIRTSLWILLSPLASIFRLQLSLKRKGVGFTRWVCAGLCMSTFSHSTSGVLTCWPLFPITAVDSGRCPSCVSFWPQDTSGPHQLPLLPHEQPCSLLWPLYPLLAHCPIATGHVTILECSSDHMQSHSGLILGGGERDQKPNFFS